MFSGRLIKSYLLQGRVLGLGLLGCEPVRVSEAEGGRHVGQHHPGHSELHPQ